MKAAHPDPAWRGRVTATLVCLLLLWPMLAASEFKPWLLFDPQSLAAAGHFLSDFLRPSTEPDFLALVLRETWQTVAIATAGLSLALLGAVPATMVISERLSISRLGTGRMHPLASALRQLLRWVLVLLRSVPELVWALLFVRIVGLGPTTASRVPTRDMASVSHSAAAVFARKAAPVSGGVKPARNSAPDASASGVKKADHCSGSEAKLAATRAASANSSSGVRQLRGGGGGSCGLIPASAAAAWRPGRPAPPAART